MVHKSSWLCVWGSALTAAQHLTAMHSAVHWIFEEYLNIEYWTWNIKYLIIEEVPTLLHSSKLHWTVQWTVWTVFNLISEDIVQIFFIFFQNINFEEVPTLQCTGALNSALHWRTILERNEFHLICVTWSSIPDFLILF